MVLLKKKISNANILRKGEDLTIVASSHMTTEAIIAGKILQKNNIYPEIIDLRSVKPLDLKKIEKSVKKTKKTNCYRLWIFIWINCK